MTTSIATPDGEPAEGRGPDDRISMGDYALLALHNLGGGEDYIDIEDIAIEAFGLAPSMFSWRRHKNLPSVEAIRMSFRNMERARSDQYVVSAYHGQARMLTPAGIHRANEVRRLVGAEGTASIRDALRRPVNRDLARMMTHPAYEQWKVGGVATLDRLDVGDLLHVISGSPASVYREAMSRALSQATSLDHIDLIAFLTECISHLDEILARGTT